MTAIITGRRRMALTAMLLLILVALAAPPADAQAQAKPPSFADLAAKASPAVVNIRIVKTVDQPAMIPMPGFSGPHGGFGPQGPDLHEFFRRFFGGPGGPGMHPRKFKQRALGSGVIVNPQGYILTNNHVVEGADKIVVKMKTGEEIQAEIVGRDPKTDLALIKLKKNGEYPSLPLGDSDKLRVGDWVLAVGNPFGLEHTVTAGIVSAKGRIIGAGPYDDFIQTDASINPGNSGGPLINLAGELVGINTAIVPQGQGIGFAIPVNMAKNIMDQLLKKGRVVRGWLGVYIQPVTEELAAKFKLDKDKGALVGDVIKDSPAEKAGLKRGDVIVSYDGRAVNESSALPAMVARTKVGAKVKVEVIRQGKRRALEVKIGELKPEHIEAARGSGGAARWGLDLQKLNPELASQLGVSTDKGVVITRTTPGGPAATAGLRRGDVILEAGRSTVTSPSDFLAAAGRLKKGEGLLLLVQRGERTMYVVLKPAG